MRRWMAVAAGVLLLTSGCVARTGEPPAATSTTTTTSSPPETENPAFAEGAAKILARGHGSWRYVMCEPPFTPNPYAPADADFTGTLSAGIDTYVLPMDGEAVVARLSVEPGLDLMLAIMIEIGTTSDWCAYAFTWCPAGFPGLPPFMVGHSEAATMDELDREVLCGR